MIILLDTRPDYLKEINATLDVYDEVVVLPTSETNTEDNTKTVTGGSITTPVFDCTKIDLKLGSKGDDVKKLQTILKASNWYSRAIDGDYGKYTSEGVKQLQKKIGVTESGSFDSETCKKYYNTSNTDANTSNEKVKSLQITDFKGDPQISKDTEGLTYEITVNTYYTAEKMKWLKKLVKTQYTLYHGIDPVITHTGYVNSIKISNDDDEYLIELQIVGYVVFLEQTVTYEKTGKQSEILKELAELAGIKLELDMTGLTDNECTVKASASTGESSAEGMTQMSGNDCSETFDISTRSFDISKTANNKIGNSSANYATGTQGMSGKDAIMAIYNRFDYDYYCNNRTCPQKMYNEGTIHGNCADISRLVMAVGQVHGMTIGIRHMSGHYYNLIEVGGQTYRFDCCCKSSGSYKGEITNTLTKRGGPWQ